MTFAKPFAMSRYQVTAGELDAYIKATGTVIKSGDDRPDRWCEASKPSYKQGPRQPAVCIDYDEVQAYTRWLAETTGKPYRMVSEAEREYAARAGSSGPFPFPFDEPGKYEISKHANTYGPKDGYTFTAPVGSYSPNAFGLYDMHGNVYEWVADCYHDSYEGAPPTAVPGSRTPSASARTCAATTGASPDLLPLGQPQRPPQDHPR